MVFASVIVIVFLCVLKYIYRKYYSVENKRYNNRNKNKFCGRIGFFHPFCNDCGGGEKVLWYTILAIQHKWPDAELKIMSCDPNDIINMVKKANERFNVDIKTDNLQIVYVNGSKWILPQTYPYCTLIGQSIGSMFLALLFSIKFVPDIYIDTTGFAFTSIIFKLFGCESVGAYVHYPTISSDMISRVQNNVEMYNNSETISQSASLTIIKQIYYLIFAQLYRLGASFIDYSLCNSNWTLNHILNLWGVSPAKCSVVNPPCSPKLFLSDCSDRQPHILSISQFRPEKDHKMQIDIMKALVTAKVNDDSLLIIAGSVRSDKDLKYMESLKNYAKEIGICDRIRFKINLPFHELKELMSTCLIGLHTMNQEHFGIGIVEMMASGLIMVAHKSGGPQTDIVINTESCHVGYLASQIEEYRDIMSKIYSMSDTEIDLIRSNSINRVLAGFSDDKFTSEICRFIEKLILVL